MSVELTADGLTIETQAEIQAAIEADQIAEISDTLDQSTSSALGQLNRIVSRALRVYQEALEALASATDPDGATGDALFRLGALTGTLREPATASRLTAVLDLDAGTYAIGALIVYPTGRPSETFANLEEVVSAGGGADSVVFEATATGPTQVAANDVLISAAVSGWNSIVSSSIATPGAAIETEAAFRQRRNQEVEAPGSSSVDGIRADLTRNLPLIETVTVVENATDATVDSIPAHSIEVVVFGPDPATGDDDQAVADQIFASKAAGIGTYGNTTYTVQDSSGANHSISFTRPVDVDVDIYVEVEVAPDYAGDDALAAAIEAGRLADMRPGVDLAWSNVVSWAMGVQGVRRVVTIEIDSTQFGVHVITSRERATIGTLTYLSSEAAP